MTAVFFGFLWSPSALALKVNILEDKQLQFKVNENTKKCSSLSDNFSLFIKKIVLSLFISLLRLIIYHLNYTLGIFLVNSKQTEIKKDLIEIGIGPLAKIPWGKVE